MLLSQGIREPESCMLSLKTQQAITCSTSTIKTLKKGVKYVSKLTINTPGRRCNVFIVNFETYFTPVSNVSTADFEKVIVCWERYATTSHKKIKYMSLDVLVTAHKKIFNSVITSQQMGIDEFILDF